jgi:hypothetical protein
MNTSPGAATSGERSSTIKPRPPQLASCAAKFRGEYRKWLAAARFFQKRCSFWERLRNSASIVADQTGFDGGTAEA